MARAAIPDRVRIEPADGVRVDHFDHVSEVEVAALIEVAASMGCSLSDLHARSLVAHAESDRRRREAIILAFTTAPG